MGNPVAEKTTFAAFLAAAPDFAGEAVQNWCQPVQDPPDVLCTTVSGRQVGLELTGWLDEDQIADAKNTESIEDSFRKAIQPDPPNNTEHIHFAWLLTVPKARIKPADATAFRSALLRLRLRRLRGGSRSTPRVRPGPHVFDYLTPPIRGCACHQAEGGFAPPPVARGETSAGVRSIRS